MPACLRAGVLTGRSRSLGWPGRRKRNAAAAPKHLGASARPRLPHIPRGPQRRRMLSRQPQPLHPDAPRSKTNPWMTPACTSRSRGSQEARK
jgi:hypothetical protein